MVALTLSPYESITTTEGNQLLGSQTMDSEVSHGLMRCLAYGGKVRILGAKSGGEGSVTSVARLEELS